jgi:hypothetical protein
MLGKRRPAERSILLRDALDKQGSTERRDPGALYEGREETAIGFDEASGVFLLGWSGENILKRY